MKKLKITVEGKTYEVVVEIPDEGRPSGPVPMRVVSASPVSAPVVVANDQVHGAMTPAAGVKLVEEIIAREQS